MKTLVLITTLILLSPHAYGIKTPGTIISNGESQNVTFDIKVPLLAGEPNFERLQYKVRYYDENGQKRTLRPDDADEIRFKLGGIQVRMISCANTFGAGSIFSTASRIFLRLELDGALKLYRYYFKQNNSGYSAGAGAYVPGPTFTHDNLILQKGNGPLKHPRGLGWKKDMLEYFSDCPALREQIESKDLRRNDIEAMVLYYNRNCAKR